MTAAYIAVGLTWLVLGVCLLAAYSDRQTEDARAVAGLVGVLAFTTAYLLLAGAVAV